MNYYNEFDPYAAQWLRNLIKAGHIPVGDVDDRSITDVCARDLKGYTQCHFFAGIGGWSRALQLAEFPTDRQVWTGSCPCQPFSVAGKGKGTDDERHLWPVWFNLIKECQPSVIFGEQVAAAMGHGWIDGVFADLENEDYACAAAIIPACSVGAPHRRERLWFVADSNSAMPYRSGESRKRRWLEFANGGCDVADAANLQRDGGEYNARSNQQSRDAMQKSGDGDGDGIMGNTQHNGLFTESEHGITVSAICNNAQGANSASEFEGASSPRELSSFWQSAEWLQCADGKQRRIEPSIRLLADGLPGGVVELRTGEETPHYYSRIGALKAFGNAIVPQVAAEFIKAFIDNEK